MIKKWTKYVFIYIGYVVIAIMLAIVIKGKLSYKSLFSQEFCDSSEKIYFYDFNEDVYEITDKDVIAEVGKILYENGYKKLKKKDSDIKLVTIYSLYYDGRYEQYRDKKELLNRMIEIYKEL